MKKQNSLRVIIRCTDVIVVAILGNVYRKVSINVDLRVLAR